MFFKHLLRELPHFTANIGPVLFNMMETDIAVRGLGLDHILREGLNKNLLSAR